MVQPGGKSLLARGTAGPSHARLGASSFQTWSMGDNISRSTMDDPVIQAIAETHDRTPAQEMLRCTHSRTRSAIPKTVTPMRMVENIMLFDFDLSGDEWAAIDALEIGVHGGPDPEASVRGTPTSRCPRPSGLGREYCAADRAT